MSIVFNGIRSTGKIPLLVDANGAYIDVLINKKKFKMAIDTAFNYIVMDNKILNKNI